MHPDRKKYNFLPINLRHTCLLALLMLGIAGCTTEEDSYHPYNQPQGCISETVPPEGLPTLTVPMLNPTDDASEYTFKSRFTLSREIFTLQENVPVSFSLPAGQAQAFYITRAGTFTAKAFNTEVYQGYTILGNRIEENGTLHGISPQAGNDLVIQVKANELVIVSGLGCNQAVEFSAFMSN